MNVFEARGIKNNNQKQPVLNEICVSGGTFRGTSGAPSTRNLTIFSGILLIIVRKIRAWKKPGNPLISRVFGLYSLAGAQRLELWTRGFGDRCSTN